MKYHNITKDDMLNGDGLRVVLWVSGCTHGCTECHNPMTWDINCGLLFDADAKGELFSQLSKDYTSGITLSGGDPLHPMNRMEIGSLVEEIHEKYPDKSIWLYTGYCWDDIKDLTFIPLVDVIIDGQFQADKKDEHLKWRGSSNQKVINVSKTLEKGRMVLYVE